MITETMKKTNLVRLLVAISGLAVLLAVSGCQTQHDAFEKMPALSKNSSTNAISGQSEAITLRAGDTVKISFPGAPTLDTTQQILRDGTIVLPLTGEAKAAGLTPTQLGQEVTKLYASQLTVKEVVVTLVSSTFSVYVTGAVLKPGEVDSDRPISALEAIMKAGGFDYTKANLKDVKVIRQENSQEQHFTLNLRAAMQGDSSKPFYLKPSDIIYVPEKFTWF
jgi:polysaccharide biosynthesis/export protein